MDSQEINENISGPSSLSSDQASLCVIPDPDDLSEEDDFIHLDKNCLPSSLSSSETDRTVIVFHSVEEEYQTETDVLCQYIRPKGWNESAKDCVGLFKVGWVSVGECVVIVPISETPNHNTSIGCVLFAAPSLPKDNSNFYQFCYIRDSILLGASTPFQFKQVAEQECIFNQNESKENSVILQVEEKLAEQLRSRDLDLTRLQEIFTKLACSKDEQDKVYSSTVEGLEKQLEFQSVCIKKLAEEKAGLLTEKSQMSQEITNLSALIEELKMKSLPNDNCSYESSHGLQSLADTGFGNGAFTSSFSLLENTTSLSRADLLSNNQPITKFAEHQKKVFHDTKPSCETELVLLKQRLSEVVEEKRLFQEQYGMASVTLKQCTDELAAERVNIAALKSYIYELMASHEMVCSELRNELRTSKDKYQEAISENSRFTEELSYLRDQLKKFEESEQKSDCQCETFKKKFEEVAMRLSSTDLINVTLQAELDEELKLGEDRDRRLAQLEQTMFSHLHPKGQQAAAAVGAGNGTSIFEMEQNIHSALEALECALKEIETLRSRKSAISRANRALREGIAKEKKEWEEEIQILRDDYAKHVLELSKQLTSETSDKLALQKELDELQKHNLQHVSEVECSDSNSQNKEMEANTRSVLEALEAAQREIDSLRAQKTTLYDHCHMLRQQLKEKNDADKTSEFSEEHNCGLVSKLQDACDEYHKLYVEKKRIQEKLDRLQQKIKTKASSRGRQPSLSLTSQTSEALSSPANLDGFDSATCRSAAWRAMVEELM